MKPSRHDPLTYVFPRTLEQAFGEDYGPIEWPQEPSLLKWWSDVCAALAIVLTCIIVLRAVS